MREKCTVVILRKRYVQLPNVFSHRKVGSISRRNYVKQASEIREGMRDQNSKVKQIRHTLADLRGAASHVPRSVRLAFCHRLGLVIEVTPTLRPSSQ